MPLAKIHVVEGRYDQARIAKVSGAIQAALSALRCSSIRNFPVTSPSSPMSGPPLRPSTRKSKCSSIHVTPKHEVAFSRGR